MELKTLKLLVNRLLNTGLALTGAVFSTVFRVDLEYLHNVSVYYIFIYI